MVDDGVCHITQISCPSDSVLIDLDQKKYWLTGAESDGRYLCSCWPAKPLLTGFESCCEDGRILLKLLCF